MEENLTPPLDPSQISLAERYASLNLAELPTHSHPQPPSLKFPPGTVIPKRIGRG